MFIQKNIDDFIKDPEQRMSLYSKYKLIPVFGTTEKSSQYALELIKDLCGLSASHTSCKRDISGYAFGGSISAVKRPIPGVYYPIEELEVDRDKQLQFFEQMIDLGITPIKLLEISKLLFSDLADSGNTYLHIKAFSVNGRYKASLEVKNYLEVMYLEPTNGVQRALVSEIFDEDYWRRFPPLSIPVSELGQPFVWQKRNGIHETLLHIKNKESAGKFYGVSPIIPVLEDMYAEYKSSRLNAVIAGTELVAKHLLLFEEQNPARTVAGSAKNQQKTREEAFKAKIQAIRDIATVEGGHQVSSGIAAMQYPYGGKKPEILTFDVNRDTEYAKFTVEKATSSVYAAHGWAKELTGQATVKAGVGANMLYDLFLVKNVATIRPIQERFSAIFADIFDNLDTVIGRDPLKMTIKYPDVISDMIKTFRNADSSTFIEQGANPIDQQKQSTSMRGRSSKNQSVG